MIPAEWLPQLHGYLSTRHRVHLF